MNSRPTAGRIAALTLLLAALLVSVMTDCTSDEPPEPARDGAGQALPAKIERPIVAGTPPARAAIEWPPPEASPLDGELFTWMWEAAGDWSHTSSESGEYRLPEIVCGGLAMLDYDLDGDVDVFATTGGVWPDLQPDTAPAGHALFRNEGDWTFTNVAREAGVFGETTPYVMGAVAADADNDGDPDLYLTAYGRNIFYRNEGDGTFTDATEEAGIGGGEAFSSSACWLDADRDGWLDLYVVNYVEYDHEMNRKKDCGVPITGFRDFCSPREFRGVQDYFFHNNGDGTFTEVAKEVGLQCPEPIQTEGKGLGVVATDIDADGDTDLYVSNDSTRNLLFFNEDGRFLEDGVFNGCAYSESGQAQAGMGTEAGDFDADGDMDLWVVHLDFETNALYRNDGKGFFQDDNQQAGLSNASAGQVGFGTDFFDFDQDGLLDLIVTNGHVLVNVDHSRGGELHYRQRDQLFVNLGEGRFAEVKPDRAGGYFRRANAGRGLATGDLDGDGDLDVVINVRDEPPTFLRNNHGGSGTRHGSVLLSLVGRTSNRGAVGSRVTLTIGDRHQVDEVRAGSSFCSSHDPRLHFGTGGAATIDRIEVAWPSGKKSVFEEVAAGRAYRIDEAAGLEEIRAFGD